MSVARHHFASYNASAPDDKAVPATLYAVNLKGNRRLNCAVQIVAVAQIAHDCSGRRCYERTLAGASQERKPCRR